MNKKKLKTLVESIVYEAIEETTDPHQYLPKIVDDFVKYAKQPMGFNKSVKVILRKDKENAKDFLGKTGYYDPNDNTIVLYVTNRLPKDVMRTLSHELVHHTQNCQNRFLPMIEGESQNVKDNSHIKELEREAYERGNMVFREWEEKLKEGQEYLEEFNAMGTGAVVGYMAPLGMDMKPVHDAMWSGDKPEKKKKKLNSESNEGIGKAPLFNDDKKGLDKVHDEMQAGDEQLPLEEEFLGKKGGLSYFQMGGSLPDNLYNKTDSGKPTRDPGVAGLSKKDKK